MMDERIKNRLRRASLRATPHRIRILSLLEQEARPLSHLEILQSITEFRLDRVTLYRILASLTEAGIVHQVQGTDGIWRFCAHDETDNQCPGGHPHLLCEKCGTMMCLNHTRMQHVDVPEDFEVHHKQLIIVGLCAKCRKQ